MPVSFATEQQRKRRLAMGRLQPLDQADLFAGPGAATAFANSPEDTEQNDPDTIENPDDVDSPENTQSKTDIAQQKLFDEAVLMGVRSLEGSLATVIAAPFATLALDAVAVAGVFGWRVPFVNKKIPRLPIFPHMLIIVTATLLLALAVTIIAIPIIVISACSDSTLKMIECTYLGFVDFLKMLF